MLAGLAVPGCCFVSFNFLCDIHSVHPVHIMASLWDRVLQFSQPLRHSDFSYSIHQSYIKVNAHTRKIVLHNFPCSEPCDSIQSFFSWNFKEKCIAKNRLPVPGDPYPIDPLSLALSLSLSLSFAFRNWRANSLIRKKAAALCEVSLRLPSSLLLTSPFWLSSYSYAQVSFGEGGKMRLGKTSVSYLILSYLALVVIRRRKDS